MTKVGEVIYDAKINTSGLDKDAQAVENKIASVTTKVAKIALAGAGVLTGMAVKSFAEYEQVTGGVETLFKDSADTVKKYANSAYKTAGLSANDYMSTITSFSASLLQGLGGDTKKAAQIGDMAVRDMSDNANKFGTDISMIQNAYQGFAKDNFMMLDNLKLGYGGTAGEMARLVNDSGVLGDSFTATAENIKDIPFDQLILAINKTQTAMGITGTTAKESSDTISGSWSSLKSAFTNVLTGVEGSSEQLSDTVLNMFDQLAKKVPDIVGNMASAMFGAIKTVVDKQLFGGAFDIISTLVVGLGGLAVGITVVAKSIALVTGVMKVFGITTTIATGPIGLLAVAIAAVVAGIIYFYTQTETGQRILRYFGEWINESFLPTIRKIGDFFVNAWKTVVNTWSGIGGWFSGLGSGMVNAGKHIIDGLLAGINNGKNAVINKVKDIASGALDAVKKFFGIKSPSRVMAGVGDNIMLGLAQGMDKGAKSALSSAISASGDILDSFGGVISPNISSEYNGATAGSRGVAMTNNYTVNNLADAQALSYEIAGKVKFA